MHIGAAVEPVLRYQRGEDGFMSRQTGGSSIGGGGMRSRRFGGRTTTYEVNSETNYMAKIKKDLDNFINMIFPQSKRSNFFGL